MTDNQGAPPLTKSEQKQIVKEAIKEWLNETWAEFGKWSARSIAAIVISVVAYLWLSQHGWRR